MADSIRTEYRVVTITKGEVTLTQSFDDVRAAVDEMFEQTGGAGMPWDDVDDIVDMFEENGPFGVDMGAGVKIELVSRKVVSIEPDWEGLRRFIMQVAKTDPDVARDMNASMGDEAIPVAELEAVIR